MLPCVHSPRASTLAVKRIMDADWHCPVFVAIIFDQRGYGTVGYISYDLFLVCNSRTEVLKHGQSP